MNDCDDVETFLTTYGTLGTLSTFHTVTDGPLKGETVGITSDDVTRNKRTYYSWNGTRAYYAHTDGSCLIVNVFEELPFVHVIDRDEKADVAALKVELPKTSALDNTTFTEIKPDYIHGIGLVNICPSQIGEYLELYEQDKLHEN